MKNTDFHMVCGVCEKEEQEKDDKANEAKCKQLMSLGKCCKGVAYSFAALLKFEITSK